MTTARQRRLFERSVLQCFMTHLNVTLGGKKKKQRLNSRRACCHRSLNSPSSSLQPTFFTMHLPAQPLHGDTNSITLPRNPFPWVGGPNYLSSATSPKCPEWLLHDSSGWLAAACTRSRFAPLLRRHVYFTSRDVEFIQTVWLPAMKGTLLH